MYKQNFKLAKTVHQPKQCDTRLDAQAKSSKCKESQSPSKETLRLQAKTPTPGNSNSTPVYATMHVTPKGKTLVQENVF